MEMNDYGSDGSGFSDDELIPEWAKNIHVSSQLDISLATQDMGAAFDIYYRNLDPNGPRQDLMDYAQLAIASYNKRKSQRYTVVDMIRSEMYYCAGKSVFIEFTAKLPNQNDADAIKFRAKLWYKIGGDIEVIFTRPISEEEAASDRISGP